MGCTPSNVKTINSNGESTIDGNVKKENEELRHLVKEAKFLQENKVVKQKTESDSKSKEQTTKMESSDNFVAKETMHEISVNDQSKLSGKTEKLDTRINSAESQATLSEPSVNTLSEEDKIRMKEESLQKLRQSIAIVKDMNAHKDEKGVFKQNFKFAAFQIQKAHFAMKGVPLPEYYQYQREEGAVMTENNGIGSILDTIIYCMGKSYYDEDGKVISGIWNVLVNLTVAILNFTDMNPNFVHLVVEHPSYLDCVLDYLQTNRQQYLDNQLEEKEVKMVNYLLSITHNIAQAEDHAVSLRSKGFVDVLLLYLNAKTKKTILTVLASLADLLDESEAKKIEANQEFFKSLMEFLSKALADSKRRHQGWSSRELARTIRRLARNDSNKRALVTNGSLPLLVELIGSQDLEEKREAFGALWTLSFDEDNQDTMISGTDGVIEVFLSHRFSTESKIKKSCNGALWNMREKLKLSEKYKEIGHEYSRGEKDKDNVKQTGHVMLSYQWGHQNLVKEIRNGLRNNGIKVWMDIDDMEGSTLNAMARAVEDAQIVLVCYSQKYKDSDNCRSEAEYAFQIKKKIIPVKLERQYKADGWLGFVIGAKLFFDFSGKYSFESRMEGLVKEICRFLKRAPPEEIIVPHMTNTTSAVQGGDTSMSPAVYVPNMVSTPIVTADAAVRGWNSGQVQAWVKKHDLSSSQFSSITGTEVAFLQVLRRESPDNFYRVLREMLRITDLLTMAKLTFALEDTNI
ncbi:hypothetical protein FSP39_018644 [Pinctada imbricata]|uniref:TIR domain-containing protein n=1 Tax=Pinctada imbricata TaxID=66713 RepID=A0AA88XDI1_PINIB|nr:hypothetical protein FSP39_018644 [Pinctada imbricata]